ncbi:MAG: ribosome recycling factor [Patescibacteria group bacterium]|nr:ribosome recycling factor [Patescibacteria group bacterium]MDD5121747.1 ribosome recycling factor [Patescibacteria group bacterium]MDD5222181.1 ribosome recycling factor [Patescibacteria group bacterium]MDD5396401.1 ribosome recycling factor [Patescibacteria group bacterium]
MKRRDNYYFFMAIDLKNFQENVQKTLEALKKDVQTIRTGRATADLISHILVEAYGVRTPIDQLASITIPEPRLIIIQPWDRNLVKEIEIALTQANLGTLPSVRESLIHVNLPPLNEETRKNLVKILNQKLEHWRNEIRSERDEFRSKINKAAKDKEITEDDKFEFFEDLDKSSSKIMEEIDQIGVKKEKEITTI